MKEGKKAKKQETKIKQKKKFKKNQTIKMVWVVSE